MVCGDARFTNGPWFTSGPRLVGEPLFTSGLRLVSDPRFTNGPRFNAAWGLPVARGLPMAVVHQWSVVHRRLAVAGGPRFNRGSRLVGDPRFTSDPQLAGDQWFTNDPRFNGGSRVASGRGSPVARDSQLAAVRQWTTVGPWPRLASGPRFTTGRGSPVASGQQHQHCNPAQRLRFTTAPLDALLHPCQTAVCAHGSP